MSVMAGFAGQERVEGKTCIDARPDSRRDRAAIAQGSPRAAKGRFFASNAGMEPLHHIESRLTELEIKACFTEDLVDTLNRLVARQQDQIDLLMRELGQLRQQPPLGEPAALRNPRDDLPPHY
jgi:SlyX protein